MCTYICVYYIQSMSTELRSGWWCFGLDMHGYHWFLYNTGSLTLTNQTLYIYWLSLNPNLDGLNMIEPQNPDTLANEDIVIFIHKQINAIYQAISSKKNEHHKQMIALIASPPKQNTLHRPWPKALLEPAGGGRTKDGYVCICIATAIIAIYATEWLFYECSVLAYYLSIYILLYYIILYIVLYCIKLY